MTSAAGDSLAAAGVRVIFTQPWLTLCMWAGTLLAPPLPGLFLIQLSRGPSHLHGAHDRWQYRGRVSPRVQMSSSSIQKRFTLGYTDARGVAPERAGADQAIGGAPVAAEDAPVERRWRVHRRDFRGVLTGRDVGL